MAAAVLLLMLLLLLPAAPADAGSFAASPSWSASRCLLSGGGSTSAGRGAHYDAGAAGSDATVSVWFVDVGDKVFRSDTAPAATCGATLNLSAARGESATFQIAVRSTARKLTGVTISLAGGPGAATDVRRAAFTNVTTAANNLSSAGVGMYPDPLPHPNDTVIFPQGGDTIQPLVTAVFWITIPIPTSIAAGVHAMQLNVAGTGIAPHPMALHIWDFTLPDAGHASQWTEADFGGALQGCNIIDEPKRPIGCSANRTDFPNGPMQPCLTTETVDNYYREMAKHRINRVAWMNSWDFLTGVGLIISNDTQSVALDTTAFDANVEKLHALGYRDIKLPIPACSNGGSCSFNSAGTVDPNSKWTFANSTHFNSATGRGWHGNCEGSSGCVMGMNIVEITVPMFDNTSLNAPSATNASEKAYMTQAVGDVVKLNPEFVRLFRLVMTPVVRHLRAKGWINRTYAFISDETRWPTYSGTNFTVNAWVAVTTLYRSLDPDLKVQQDLTPQTDGVVWEAVAPLVDAWVWQEGQFQFGVASGTGAKAASIEKHLGLVAKARRNGADAYIYNNEIAVIDLPAHRVRTFPWQLWRTNYVRVRACHIFSEYSRLTMSKLTPLSAP